jgi:hypothetical protein
MENEALAYHLLGSIRSAVGPGQRGSNVGSAEKQLRPVVAHEWIEAATLMRSCELCFLGIGANNMPSSFVNTCTKRGFRFSP